MTPRNREIRRSGMVVVGPSIFFVAIAAVIVIVVVGLIIAGVIALMRRGGR